MAGSATKKKVNSFDGYSIEWSFVADAAGAVSGVGAFSANGFLYNIIYKPGTATNLYALTLLDSDSIDVLRGNGANQSDSASLTYDTKYRGNVTDVDGQYIFFFNETLTPTIANAGNGGTGTIIFEFSKKQS